MSIKASLFVIMFLLVLLPVSFCDQAFSKESATVSATGYKSPAINAGGNVMVIYNGVSQEVHESLLDLFKGKEAQVNKLFDLLDKKDVAIEQRDKEVRDWIKKYKKLEISLSARSSKDEYAAKASERLQEGDLEGAASFIQMSLELKLSNITVLKESAAEDAFELAKLKELQLEFMEARQYFEQAVKLAPENPDYINTFSHHLLVLGEYKKVVALYGNALRHIIENNGEKSEYVANAYNNLGSAWQDLGEPKKAIEHYEKALEIDLAVFGDKHPKVATRYNNLGSAWQDLGEPKKAIEYYEKALEIVTGVFGDNHPHVAASNNNLGSAWQDLGEPKKAIEYFEKALEVDLAAFGDKHPNVATRYNNLGGAWGALGDNKKAIEYLEKALVILHNVFGDNHPHVAASNNNLGSAWKALGEPKKAIEYYEKALEIFTSVFGSEHPSTITVQRNLDIIKRP